MKKFIIDNLKYVFSFILGAIVFGGTAVYAYNFATDQVKHTKSDNSETTVELALNELYQMYDADTIILSKIYPVGSYYMTSDANANPATLFGGTWTQITDKVLVAAGSTYSAGSTGGNGTLTYTPAGTNSGGAVGNHTLTISEMPSHNHSITYNSVEGVGNLSQLYRALVAEGSVKGTKVTNDGTNQGSEWNNALAIANKGGGQAHNHPFTQPTFTGTQATLQTMNSLPRETVYVWKRTA